MKKVLKLDSSYRPVQIVDIYEAFSMLFLGRANLVEAYDGEFLNSVNESFPIPCVIALNKYIKRDKLTLKCNKKNIFWRDNNTCQYCGDKYSEADLTMDHVTPRSLGGPKTWENIVTSCFRCNQRKGNKLPFQVNMRPLKNPVQPTSDIFHVLERDNFHDKWIPYLAGKK